MALRRSHTALSLSFLQDFHSALNSVISLTGADLSIPKLHAISHKLHARVQVDESRLRAVQRNADYLKEKVDSGAVIYGVSTGFGGSADVRSSNIEEVQKSLVRHLNAGFSTKCPLEVTRGVMAARVNSLCRAMSGVRPRVVTLLTEMLNHDIVPEVPLRGSVSASGDLMPQSYIAAAMQGRPDAKVVKDGKTMFAPEALAQAGLEPITFQAKEALGVVNSSSVAASLASSVLYEANKAALLTQVAVAMTHEALLGRRESFHPTISSVCLPHPGHIEVAHNVWSLLSGSKFAITEAEVDREDDATALKQDRYALRTSAQWLASVPETLLESVRRVETELNSTGDNPVIDDNSDAVLHCGNFQGTSVTVAMDQARQALQLCGKLLFAQMSEMLNVKMSGGLPPNLSGSDTTTDFGYKGTDTAQAAYCAELDALTPPLTSHVLSAEMHNQAVNSLALVSARRSREALDVLHMMLTNILNAQVQAIDLRFLQRRVLRALSRIFTEHGVQSKLVHAEVWPWYDFAFRPARTCEDLLRTLDHTGAGCSLVQDVVREMSDLTCSMRRGEHTEEIAQMLGTGSARMYRFLRDDVGIRFYHGERSLDTDLQRIHDAITAPGGALDAVLTDVFRETVESDAGERARGAGERGPEAPGESRRLDVCHSRL